MKITYEIIEIPISPSKEVFAEKDEKTEVKKLVKTIGQDFISGIKEDEKKEVTFIDRLHRKLKKESMEVRTVISDCLRQAEGE